MEKSERNGKKGRQPLREEDSIRGLSCLGGGARAPPLESKQCIARQWVLAAVAWPPPDAPELACDKRQDSRVDNR